MVRLGHTLQAPQSGLCDQGGGQGGQHTAGGNTDRAVEGEEEAGASRDQELAGKGAGGKSGAPGS